MGSERKIIGDNVRRMLVHEFVAKETQRAGFGGMEIKRTPVGTSIQLIAERPGIVIGQKGKKIFALTNAIQARFGIVNPQVEVTEERYPNLNPQIMAEKLAASLERGWHFRRAGHSTVRRIMQSGARGCLISLAGKLTGARHRLEKFKSGNIKYCGEPALYAVDSGFATAHVRLGSIGVKVAIMPPDAKLPDEITIFPPGSADPVAEPAEGAEGTEEVPVEVAEEAKTTPEATSDEKAAMALDEETPTAEAAAPEVDVPTEEPETEETPTEEASTEEAPTEEASTEEAPTEEAPTEETPTEETPTDETPTEEASTEEAPTEETPTDETPAEEPKEDDA